MIKVGILTLNGYFNYGNRLQNYALQEALRSMGCEVETIINGNIPLENKDATLFKKATNLLNRSMRFSYSKLEYKLWSMLHKNEIKTSQEMNIKIFKKFTSDFIKETEHTISDNNIPKSLSKKYDYFVTGSDQVWNPDYIYGSSIYFLTFAEKQKRIAYAPSFGVSEIEPKNIESYKKWISEMHKLSIREDDGAKIIKNLTGRDAPVLVDPTLLLTKEKWLSLTNEAINKPKNKYLLTYFLGGIPPEYKKQIKKIATENNLEVVNLSDIREKETFRTGPSEFIDYINSSSIFCTDSFHGTVFSILLSKPFIVFERVGNSLSMFSRINTLLDKFDLNSRKSENLKTNEDVFKIDYSHVPIILEKERQKAFDYLKDALEIKDGH